MRLRGLEVRLRRPGRKAVTSLAYCATVSRHDRLAVRILDTRPAVAQGLRHGDDVAGEVLVVVAARRHLDALRRLLVAVEQRDDVVGAVLGTARARPDEPREAALKVRAFAMSDRSGGALPPLAAAAACSFGKFHGKRSAGRPARSNISPASFGPSLTLYSAASALTWPFVNSGPPGSARLRKAMQLEAVAGLSRPRGRP